MRKGGWVRHGALLLGSAGILGLALAGAQATGTGGQVANIFTSTSRTPCLYATNSLSLGRTFSDQADKSFNCLMLYNNAIDTWARWSSPWLLHTHSGDHDLLSWKKAVPGRRLIISQPMVPDGVPSDWRVLGARGEYQSHATALARNLVANGLGDSIIRLGWEANGDFDTESALGRDPAEYRDWGTYWATVATTMRAVPGAHFLFDWTINQYYQPIPLAEWYPGDDAVDIIGIDAYDGAVTKPHGTAEQRWLELYDLPDGLRAVSLFAKEHGKPLSLPEWGLLPATSTGGDGDDPAYMTGLANFVKDNDLVYESYFYHPGEAGLLLLPQAPRSMAVYRTQFAEGVHLPAPVRR